MPIARSRLQARRREFARAHGPLNLVPLVDILTAIVFFSLLSAVSFRAALASFDIVAPPAAAHAGDLGHASTPRPDIVVRVDRRQFVVRHRNEESFYIRGRGITVSGFRRNHNSNRITSA